MRFTDLFVRRPVLAIVVNLVILVAGLQAIRSLNVRQYPKLESATVTVRTAYVGASADLVRGFITTPLERAIAAADGVDYIESQSQQGLSTISVRLKLNFNAAAAVWSGQLDLVVSGGVEMMSRVPMGSNNGSMSPLVHEHHEIVMQGISAEEIAKQLGLTREELDRISFESHQRAARAIDEGRFDQEVVPIELDVPDPEGSGGSATATRVRFAVDEAVRRETTLEKMAELQPAFIPEGVVTAGNSSQIVDGSAAVLVASEAMPEQLAHDITQLLFERQAELAAIHPQARTLSLTGALAGSPIPFHPGAIRYYRERQVWTAKLSDARGSQTHSASSWRCTRCTGSSGSSIRTCIASVFSSSRWF
jgi:hypothetical protein